MKRASASLLLATLLGCANMGLDGAPPLEEAQIAPPPELVAAVHASTPGAEEEIIFDGGLWVPWGLPDDLLATDLRPVGSAMARPSTPGHGTGRPTTPSSPGIPRAAGRGSPS